MKHLPVAVWAVFLFLPEVFGQSPVFKPSPYAKPTMFGTPAPVDAEFYQRMQEYVVSNIAYPNDALRLGIQGTVFVQFYMDSSGYLQKNTVKIFKGLSPSCDREAIRVIKAYPGRWKNATEVPFVVPIQFNFDSNFKTELPRKNVLSHAIKAVVKEKGLTKGNPDWVMYGDPRMSVKYGTLSPGDTVQVLAWAPWACFVDDGIMSGYVTYKALSGRTDLDNLLNLIESQSAKEEQAQSSTGLTEVDDVVHSETSYLGLRSSKASLYRGECTTISLDFVMYGSSTLALKFYNIGAQLYTLFPSRLTQVDCWQQQSNIEEIVGVDKKDEKGGYTRYTIYEGRYCPTTTEPLRFESLRMVFNAVNGTADGKSKIVAFDTKPLVVDVKPLPKTVAGLSSVYDVPMVGTFSLKDSVSKNSVPVGKPVVYSVEVWGDDAIALIEPPKFSFPEANVELLSIVSGDTVLNNVAKSWRRIDYRVSFYKPGIYNLADKIAYRYFDPADGNVKTIASSKQITVTAAGGSDDSGSETMYFIAVDASRSMEISDYFPNRFAAVKMGIKKFMMAEWCDSVGLIRFGGDVKYISMPVGAKRYSPAAIDAGLVQNGLRSGTAIGDAIAFMLCALKTPTAQTKFVIIGDGDNTAGVLSPLYAARLAERRNIQIHTIGIGHTGPVPYGKDANGKPYTISDTFTDVIFRDIAEITGGTYHWAKDAQQLSDILKEIFSK